MTIALLSVGALGVVAATAGERTWLCTVCGREAERRTVLGAGWESGPPLGEPAEEVEIAARFEAWFERELALEHAHDWTPVGCFQRFGKVSCAEFPDAGWYMALPRAPDAGVARTLVERLIGRDERRAAIAGFASESPWRELAQGETLEPSDFRVRCEAWIARHPEWR